jgi:hypothetical protein
MEIADGLRKHLPAKRFLEPCRLTVAFLEDRPFTCVTSQSPARDESSPLLSASNKLPQLLCQRHPSGGQHAEVDVTVLAERRSDQLAMISCPTNASPGEKKRNETRNLASRLAIAEFRVSGEARLENTSS